MEWWSIEPTITQMVFDNLFAFLDKDLTVLDFSPFKNVVSIEIGNKSFTYVTTVRFAELPKLESVSFGFHSFFPVMMNLVKSRLWIVSFTLTIVHH